MEKELSDGTVIIKIGGSQQKNHVDILRQAENIKKLYLNGCKVIAVLSAHNGNTEGIIKNSNNPWEWIKGEWHAVDYMREVLDNMGVACNIYKQNNGFPLIGDITKPELVKANLEHIISNKNPSLVAGFGLINHDGTLSLVRNGSDDVAAILASRLIDSYLIYQKDTGGIIYPWPEGSLLEKINSEELYNKIKSGEIEKVISIGAVEVIKKFNLKAYVCNLDNWLEGTEIY